MNRIPLVVGIILLSALSGICTTLVAAQEAPLTNADLVKLTKLDMGDDVIIAKIKSAQQVQFDTSTDELVRLKEAGVSKVVIAAMIDRAAGPAAKSGGGPDFKVQLQSVEGTVDLQPIYGLIKTQTAFFSVQSWLWFADLEAKIRIKDRRPTILLALDRDPRGAWWFVQLTKYDEEDETYRYFDTESGGGGFAMTFSGAPEKGSVVQYEATQEQPGLWRIRPLKDLKNGEYGLFTGSGQPINAVFGAGGSGTLFDFGIDK